MYTITTTKLYDKRFANLGKYFALTDDEIKEAIDDIKYTMIALKKDGVLPQEYADHVLVDAPWTGFHEYHILSDLLVIYYKVDKKKNIRFTTITTHNELRRGKLK